LIGKLRERWIPTSLEFGSREGSDEEVRGPCATAAAKETGEFKGDERTETVPKEHVGYIQLGREFLSERSDEIVESPEGRAGVARFSPG